MRAHILVTTFVQTQVVPTSVPVQLDMDLSLMDIPVKVNFQFQ